MNAAIGLVRIVCTRSQHSVYHLSKTNLGNDFERLRGFAGFAGRGGGGRFPTSFGFGGRGGRDAWEGAGWYLGEVGVDGVVGV